MSSQLLSHWFILTSQPAQHKLPMVRALMLRAGVLCCERVCVYVRVRMEISPCPCVMYVCTARVPGCCTMAAGCFLPASRNRIALDLLCKVKWNFRWQNTSVKSLAGVRNIQLEVVSAIFFGCRLVETNVRVCESVCLCVCVCIPTNRNKPVPTYPWLEMACDRPYASVQSHSHLLSHSSHPLFGFQCAVTTNTHQLKHKTDTIRVDFTI